MKIYENNNLPQSIGQAIYYYGDNDIRNIVLYGEIDNEHGYILTDQALYYSFTVTDKINLSDISNLYIRKTRNSSKQLVILSHNVNHLFDESKCELDDLIDELLELTQLSLEYDMNVYDKIYYLSNLILNDIKDDIYEDLILTDTQSEELNQYLERIESTKEMDQNNYMLEMQLIVDQVMKLVSDLELDSEDVDELEKAQKEMSIEENKMFDQFENLYENNKDTVKNVTGIDLDDIQNKSPEELNAMLDDLCDRFNISKDQLANLAQKFGNRQ